MPATRLPRCSSRSSLRLITIDTPASESARKYGGITRAADVGREHPLGRHDFELRAGVGDELGGGHAGMRAVVVIEEHARGGLRRAGQDVPARGREGVAGVEEARVRHAAGRDDHDVGVLGHHVGRLGIGVVADLDAEPLAFGERASRRCP